VSEILDKTWLESTRAAVNADAGFRKLGTADVRLGIKAGDRAYLVDFEAFECAAVTEIDVDQLRDADFYLDLPAKDWALYLAGRRVGKAPSLLALDLDTEGGIMRGTDPRNTLKFERYQGTLQAFFDTGAARAA